MIDAQRILHVRSLLLKEKYSQREIARLTGVSRGTVKKVATGEFMLHVIDEIKINPEGEFVRCPQCGGKTRMPCTYCAIVRVLELHSRDTSRVSSSDEKFEEIQLKGLHLKRYLQVREWREKQYDPDFTCIPEDWPWRNKFQSAK